MARCYLVATMTGFLRVFAWCVSAFVLGQKAYFSASAQALTSVPPMGTLISDRGVVLNSSAHKVYAVDQSHGGVVVIDTRTKVAKSVATGLHPDAIAVNNKTNRAYVVNSGSGTVSVLDGLSDKVIGSFKTDRRPYYIAVNETTNKAYVSNTFSKVMTVLDLDSGTTTDWPTGSGDAIAIDLKKNHVYLLGYEDPNLRIMDGTTGELSREPIGSIHAWAPAMDEELRKLYVTRVGTADVLAVDLETRSHTMIKVGNYPCAIAVSPKTHLTYVANYADNTVSVIDGRSDKVKQTVLVGSHPQSIALDAKRNRVYVANLQSNDISVIDSLHMKVIQTLPAGNHPYVTVADPSTGTVYVGNMPDPENPEAAVFTIIDTK